MVRFESGLDSAPGVVELAGETEVFGVSVREAGARDVGELRFEILGRGDAGGKGKRIGAEFGGRGVEDKLVDELCVQEAAVEGWAGFKEDAEDFAGGEI